jgi:hypothetical protein
MAAVMLRVEAVRQWRASRDRETTRKLAQTPTLFAEIRQPTSRYVAIPTVSSERRNFIPMGLLDPDVVASNQLYVVPDATLFHFGILSSTMHNAWVRAVCGRLESRYRYSAAIVYNNFPWPFCAPDSERNTAPALVEQAQSAIEKEAKAVLDARAAFPGSSLADLYDPLTMPPALLRAHQKLDAAVDKAYRSPAAQKLRRRCRACGLFVHPVPAPHQPAAGGAAKRRAGAQGRAAGCLMGLFVLDTAAIAAISRTRKTLMSDCWARRARRGATQPPGHAQAGEAVDVGVPARFVTTDSAAAPSAGLDGLGLVVLAEFVAAHHLAGKARRCRCIS